MSIKTKQASLDDIPTLYDLYDQMDKKDAGYFEECFARDCLILIAFTSPPSSRGLTTGSSMNEKKIPRSSRGMTEQGEAKSPVGFGVLNFKPKYRLYQNLNIPEIQDLNVIPDARQQGVATALLTEFDEIVRGQGGTQIGISVGLTKNYGAAQRLYVRQGYVPDGYGITYDREGVEHGQSYPVDDDLALMMVKEL